VDKFSLEKDIVGISKNFNKDGKISPFLNAGVMINGEISTASTSSNYTPNKNDICLLKDVLDKEKDIEEEFYIKNKELASWKYQKGAKKEERVAKNGHVYQYSEGAMVFPDSLDKPSRTIITGEGGSSASRFKHVIQPLKNKKNYRRLTPLELERLNMFPDNHTKLDGVSNSKRAFLMGNALVVGVVEKIGKELYKLHQETTNE